MNVGLMLYAHIGLSGVLLSSLDPSIIGNLENAIIVNNNSSSLCNEQDSQLWKANDGESALPTQSTFCITTYNGGGCITNSTCTESCFREQHGYSDNCAICFGTLPQCGISNGCFICITNGESAECLECLAPCVDEFYVCSGLPKVDNQNSTIISPNSAIATSPNGNSCNNYDLDVIDTWYNVYNLTFYGSVQSTWNNDAKFLACAIVFFSGIWPYLKNIMLLIVWYIPMKNTKHLCWCGYPGYRSKHYLTSLPLLPCSLVCNCNLMLEGSLKLAEPRFGIICFFLATVWEFLQIELIKAMHEKKVLAGHKSQDGEERLLFPRLWIPVLNLVAAIGLYIAGNIGELIYISSTDFGSEGTCVKSYNLAQLGNALINKISMTSNSAAGQTWFLYLVYVVLVLALPILAHIMQILFIIGRVQSMKLKAVIQWAEAVWCFACIEVLVIGIFAVEFKFEQFIVGVAGSENEDFLDIQSGLGNGFYILVAYSVVACFLQFSLGIRHTTTLPASKSFNMDEEESNPA
ncbi:LOW QUALITY PROTEIN: hypothetical protein ACHAXR_004925 [Thalassiosira sp. AJA248-18]